MRSKPNFNYPAFMEAERLLEAAGWAPIYNPAKMDIELDGMAEDGGDATIEEQEEHAADFRNARRYAWRDATVIIRKLKGENGDAIVLLDGWEESIGAVAERNLARWVRLQEHTLTTAIQEGRRKK
jgi:hypothetical protein